jgi:hypothetical protein
LPGRSCRRRRSRPSPAGPGRPKGLQIQAIRAARRLVPPSRAAVASTCWLKGTGWAGPSIGRRCGAPTGCPRTPRDYRSAAGRPWATA